MQREASIPETGGIVSRRTGRRGTLISAAVTLPSELWERLTARYTALWLDPQDDLDFRDLDLDELIALFLSDEVDRWCSSLDYNQDIS